MARTRSWLLAALAGGAFVSAGACSVAAAAFVRGLEFGPYVGSYDFDASTWFEDRALVGLRAGVRVTPHVWLDAEFDEVYTRRERSGNSARQISLAVHGRVEPASRSRVSPTLLLGIAIVGLDDSEDPDAFSEAYDMGAGLRVRVTSRWAVRGEWMLRAQRFRLLPTPGESTSGTPALEAADAAGVEASTLWSRALRIGASYAF